MKKSLTLCIVFAALTMLSSCSSTPKAKDGMQSVTNQSADFRFECPNEWKVTKNDTLVAIQSPADSTNLTVTKFKTMKQGMAVNEYFENYRKEFEAAFGKMNIIGDKETKLGGIPARRITYTNEFGGNKYKCDMIIGIRYDEAYTITFTATPEVYDTHAAVVKQVIDSFHFK